MAARCDKVTMLDPLRGKEVWKDYCPRWGKGLIGVIR